MAVFVCQAKANDRDISKYLSYVLRHAPESAGLTLDAGGWASVDAVIAASSLPLTQDRINAVVAGSDKQRFALSEDGTRIRANQGHSIPVDLDLDRVQPPKWLFHGTAKASIPAILATGLSPMTRHHVHLSADVETAHRVGQRHGSPVVLHVAAGQMAAAGHVFYRSQNGVWLTDHVAPMYLSQPTGRAG